MKTIVLAIGSAALLVAGLSASANAQELKFRNTDRPLFAKRAQPSRLGRTNRRTRVRSYRRRNDSRLPISVTRPENAGHLQYQGYPLWAARAFQPRSAGR